MRALAIGCARCWASSRRSRPSSATAAPCTTSCDTSPSTCAPSGASPTNAELDRIFDAEFYLPAANKAAHRELKANGRRLVDRYVAEHASELERLWEVERPFELRVENALVAGRADVILDEANGGPPRLTIVDYKTATNGDDAFDFQLQVYTAAGREEGLDVDGALVHDLRTATRRTVDVRPDSVAQAHKKVVQLADGIRRRKFPAKPGSSARPVTSRPSALAVRERRVSGTDSDGSADSRGRRNVT